MKPQIYFSDFKDPDDTESVPPSNNSSPSLLATITAPQESLKTFTLVLHMSKILSTA